MAIYEDTKGNTFSTQAEAAASNTALGTNPSTGGSLTTPKIADPIQPPVIPLTTAVGSVKPAKLPPTPVSTATTDLSSTSSGYLAMPAINSLNQLGTANTIAQSNAQKATADYQTNTEALINQMQNRPGQLEKQYGIQALSADALKAKANYDSVELAYRRQKEATVNNPALSADAKQSRLAEIDRKEASQKADIAIDYNLKTGLLSNAKELMQKQIALELEPMKLKVDFYKGIKEDYANILNSTQKAQLDRLEKQEDRAYQAAKEEKDLLNQFKLQAYKDGKLNVSNFNKIKSFDDLSKLTGLTKTDALTEASARSTISTIDDALKPGGGLQAAAGIGLFSRVGTGYYPFARGKAQNFIANIGQIAGQLTIDKLIQAKSSGATFGALSDGERQLVAAASSKLGTWAIKDKEGNVVGFKAKDDAVRNELQKIKNFAILDYERRTGKPYTTEDDPAGLGISASEMDPLGLFN